MAKRKQKKARKVQDPVVDEKCQKLIKLRESFKSFSAEYEEYLNGLCQRKCDAIHKMYMDKLKNIPKEIQLMKMSEVIEKFEKEKRRQTESPKEEAFFRSAYESKKMTTEKKRTAKKEKKRSLSANASTKPLALARPTNTFSRLSKALSDTSLATPARSNRLPSIAVTPKFNPKLPVSLMARQPKPGETVMSLSGSPLQNIMTNESKLSVPLLNGIELVIKDSAGLEKDFLKQLEEPLKEVIKSVKEKCNQILLS